MNILDTFDIVKKIVKNIREIKAEHNITEVWFPLDSANIEIVIYFQSIIEKLTKIKINIVDKHERARHGRSIRVC